MTRCCDNGCACKAGCERYIHPDDKPLDMPTYRVSQRKEGESRCGDFLDKRNNP